MMNYFDNLKIRTIFAPIKQLARHADFYELY